MRNSHTVPKTHLSLYREGMRVLSGNHLQNPSDEVVWLLESVTGHSRLSLFTEPTQEITQEGWNTAVHTFHRRARGEPLQYILGTQEFFGLEFLVNPWVLIPRPETECLIEEVLSLPSLNADSLMADIGTGTGCLAVTLAQQLPDARMYAVDQSPQALDTARVNAYRHRVDHRITFLLGDLFQPLGQEMLEEKFSVIVSNPPYIPSSERGSLPVEVRDHEPWLALDGGVDGLFFFRRLLSEAVPYLQPGGFLIFEVGNGQAEALVHELKGHPEYSIQSIRRDGLGIQRVFCLQWGAGR